MPKGAAQSKLEQVISDLSDTRIAEYLDALEDQCLEASHLARLRNKVSAVGSGSGPGGRAGLHAGEAAQAMKLACQTCVITADEHRCSPSVAQVYAGGSVKIAVTSGPAQSFEIVDCATQDSDVTPLIPAGKAYEWVPAAPGRHSIASHIYPGCKARIVVQPAPAGSFPPQPSSTMGSSSQVDEPIRFPLRTSRAAQTDPITSTSRFTSTSTHLPSLRPFQTASTPASVLPGITSAAAAAISANSIAFPSSEVEDLDVFNQTGLRLRRASHRPGSAGSAELRSGTPDLGLGLGRVTPSADGLSVGSGASSQTSPRASPRPLGAHIFRPVMRGIGSDLHSRGSPVSTHSSEETMPLLDIRSMNRTQGRPNPVFPTARGALVSPTSVASRDTTHKCPRCRKEFLSTINQRRCLAVHLGHKAGASSIKGSSSKAGAMPDRIQLVEFWDGLDLAEKQAIMSLKSEAGSETLLRNMEVRVLQRDVPHAHTTEQRAMLMVGRTLFEVLVRGNGLESLSGDALAKLLDKASEGTFLYDRAMPARDEVMGGFNPEAALSALVSKRLVDALLTHRQEQAERAQRELEELEEAHKGDKGKQADKGKKKQDKKAKPPKVTKPKAAGKAAKAEAAPLSRSASSATSASEASAVEDSEPGRPAAEDSARAGRASETAAAAAAAAVNAAGPAAAGGQATVTPARAAKPSVDSDNDLTPPSAHTRYTPTSAPGRSIERPAAAVTYENALFSEVDDGWAAGSWQPAGRSSGRGQYGTAGGRGAGATSGRHAGESAIGVRASQQQQKGIPRGVAEQPEAAAARVPANAGSTIGRPGAVATAAMPAAAPEEAFPALPSRAAPKGEAGAAAETAAGAGGPAPGPAAHKQPAAGISYAAAAKALGGLGKQGQRQQQASGQGPTPAPIAAPQQPASQPLSAVVAGAAVPATLEQPTPAAEAKLPPPMPVVPAMQTAAAPKGELQSSGASAAPAAPAYVPAARIEAGGPEAATAASATLAAADPAPEPSPAAAPAVTSADLQQPGATAIEMEVGAGSADEASEATLQRLEMARSLTPPLDMEGAPMDLQPGACGPQGGPFPMLPPPFGYAQQPMAPVGYYYFPVPVHTVQFGNVDMGEILQEHQQPCFFPGYPPPPMPFTTGAPMPPFPGANGMPLAAQSMQQQPFPPHEVLTDMPHESSQPSAPQQLGAEAVQPVAVATLSAPASAAAMEQAGSQTDRASLCPQVALTEAAIEVESSSKRQRQLEHAPEPSSAGPAVAAAAAERAHLAGLLHAANAAQQQQAAAATVSFDARAAASLLASRWQAAVATAVTVPQPEISQQQGQQPQQGTLRGSEGSWRSASPARADRKLQGKGSWVPAPQQQQQQQQQQRKGAWAPRGEWRPVLREQQPSQAAATQGQAGPWGKQEAPVAPSSASAGGAGTANGTSRGLTFAAVAGAAAKPANGAGLAVRGWSSIEESGEPKWRIQAAK